MTERKLEAGVKILLSFLVQNSVTEDVLKRRATIINATQPAITAVHACVTNDSLERKAAITTRHTIHSLPLQLFMYVRTKALWALRFSSVSIFLVHFALLDFVPHKTVHTVVYKGKYLLRDATLQRRRKKINCYILRCFLFLFVCFQHTFHIIMVWWSTQSCSTAPLNRCRQTKKQKQPTPGSSSSAVTLPTVEM